MALTTVVIPTLRGRENLPRCISALQAQSCQDFDVIVVDDGSTDGTAPWLAAQNWNALRHIRNAQNVGFAESCNIGIRESARVSASKFVALLNDDAFPASGWLEALHGAIERATGSDRRYGAAASKMLYCHNPALVQSAGIAMDRAAIAWDRLHGQGAASAAAMQPCEVFGASGGAALYRREMLGEIGLLDGRFFAYLEDVDLAWRAQRKGWRCAYAPNAEVLHVTSATSGQGSAFKNRLLGRNKIWMALKNATLAQWPLILLYDAMAVIWAGASRSEWSHLAGRIEGWRGARSFNRVKLSSGTVQYETLVMPWIVPFR